MGHTLRANGPQPLEHSSCVPGDEDPDVCSAGNPAFTHRHDHSQKVCVRGATEVHLALALTWRRLCQGGPCMNRARRRLWTGEESRMHESRSPAGRMASPGRRSVWSGAEAPGINQCRTFSWNISQPATALSARQKVSQNPREFFPQTRGFFSSFSMVLSIRGRAGGSVDGPGQASIVPSERGCERSVKVTRHPGCQTGIQIAVWPAAYRGNARCRAGPRVWERRRASCAAGLLIPTVSLWVRSGQKFAVGSG